MTSVVVAENFDRYVSDIPRDRLAANVAYRMKDWIPGLDARLRGRGGWTNVSPDVSTITAGPTSLAAVAWAPFSGDEHLVMIGNDGHVYYDQNLDGVTAHAASGSAIAGMTTPPFWNEDLKGLVFCSPRASRSSAVKSYTTGTPYVVAGLSGTAPTACVGASWGDYLLLANGGPPAPFVPNRIFVSGVGTPTVFATGTDFWDSSIPDIVGLVPLRAGILVLGFESTNLISGDIPPAGGNWSEETAFHGIGCFDTRTIAHYNESIIFANNHGVYMTDGVTLTDLTHQAGVKTRWEQLVKSFTYGGVFGGTVPWTAAGGIYRDNYVITVFDASGNFVTCHVFDLSSGTTFEFTNIQATMFAHSPTNPGTSLISGEERLFMASASSKRAQGLHPCWTDPDTMLDANATNVLPQLETPFYKMGGPGKKVFRSLRATYDVRTSGGSTPSLAVDYCATPGGAYTNVGSLPTTTDEDRQRVDIRARAPGVGLRLTQVGKSGHTTLSEIELDARALEGAR